MTDSIQDKEKKPTPPLPLRGYRLPLRQVYAFANGASRFSPPPDTSIGSPTAPPYRPCGIPTIAALHLTVKR